MVLLVKMAWASSPADSTKKAGYVLLPLLYYTPDTRLAVGAAGVYYFRTAKGNDTVPEPRLSYVQLLGDYTQNRQLDVWSLWSIFTKGEKYLIRGELRYRNFPDRYFGIGNASSLTQEERYAYDLFSLKLLVMQRFGKHWFAGFDYSLRHQFNFKYFTPGELASGRVTGFDGGTGSALGGVITYDSRDNIVNASKGQFFEFSSYRYHPFLGSTFTYTNLNASYSHYQKLPNTMIWASHGVVRANFGDVPFLDLAKVGNDDILRGYPSNRFRDRHYIAAQTELRFTLYKRFGGVAFVGLGDVFNTANDWSIQRIKYSVGTGLRYALNKEEKLNARIDVGFGREGPAVYISVAEAF
jgi:outer membrane protein assembly factor BamA